MARSREKALAEDHVRPTCRRREIFKRRIWFWRLRYSASERLVDGSDRPGLVLDFSVLAKIAYGRIIRISDVPFRPNISTNNRYDACDAIESQKQIRNVYRHHRNNSDVNDGDASALSMPFVQHISWIWRQPYCSEIESWQSKTILALTRTISHVIIYLRWPIR